MNKKRLIVSIIEIFIGVALFLCNEIGVVDPYWSGMGTALIVVGALNVIRSIRYRTNKDYRERVDTETKDERNRYISMKAWSWTGYLLVMILAAASIVLKIAGHENLMFLASGTVCLILVIYWIAYFILRKKY